MSRARMTTREERILLDKLGGLSTVLEIISGDVTVTTHRGPEFLPVGMVRVSPDSTVLVTFVSGRDLGLTEPATRDSIFSKATSAGLALCREGVVTAMSGTWDYRVIHIGAITTDDDTGESIIQRIEIARSQVFPDDIPDTGHLFDPEDVWVFELPSHTAS